MSGSFHVLWNGLFPGAACSVDISWVWTGLGPIYRRTSNTPQSCSLRLFEIRPASNSRRMQLDTQTRTCKLLRLLMQTRSGAARPSCPASHKNADENGASKNELSIHAPPLAGRPQATTSRFRRRKVDVKNRFLKRSDGYGIRVETKSRSQPALLKIVLGGLRGRRRPRACPTGLKYNVLGGPVQSGGLISLLNSLHRSGNRSFVHRCDSDCPEFLL
jgi:hypothetical protein